MFDKHNDFSLAKAQYEEGLSLQKTEPKNAMVLFKKSADSGYLMAASHLATIYKTGLLVKKDDEAAEKYELKADEAYDALIMSVLKNNKEAQVMLSYCYQKGIYVKQNLDLAIDFCEDALRQDPFYTPAIIELMNAWKLKNWKKGLEFLESYLNQHKMFDLNNQTLPIFLEPSFVQLLLEIADCYRKGKPVSKDEDMVSKYLEFALIKNTMLVTPVLDIWKIKNLAEKAYYEQNFHNSMIYYHYLLLLDSGQKTLAENKVNNLVNSSDAGIAISFILIRSSFLLAKFEPAIRYCDELIKLYVTSNLAINNLHEILYIQTQIFMCHALMGDLTKTKNLVPALFRMPEMSIDAALEQILQNTSSEQFPNMHNNLHQLAQFLCEHKFFRVACRLLTHILNEKQGLLKNYKPGIQLPILMEVIDCYLECTKNFTPKDKSLGKFLLSIKKYSLHATKIAEIQSPKEELQSIKNSENIVQPSLVESKLEKAEVIEKEIVQSASEPQNPVHRNIKLTAMARRFNRSETVKAFETNFELLIELLANKGSKTPSPKTTQAILDGMERFLADKERLRQRVQKSGLDIPLPVEQAPEITTPPKEFIKVLSVEDAPKSQDTEEKANCSLPLWKDEFLAKHAKDDHDIPVTPKLRKRGLSMGSVPINNDELKKFKPRIEPVLKESAKEPEKYESNEIALIPKTRELTRARKTYYENKQNRLAILPPPKSRKRSNSMFVVPDTAHTGVLPTSNREKYATEATFYADKVRESKKRKSPYPLNFLAESYYHGAGVKPSAKKASLLFDKVIAEYDLPSAYYSKGLCYRDGRGVQKNIVTAFKYFHVAARKGFTLAQVELALLYFTGGTDIEFNVKKAFKWMQRAAWANEPRAIKWMQEHYPQPPEALQILPDSAQEEKGISETALVLYKPAPKPMPKLEWRIKDIPTPSKPIVLESNPYPNTTVLPPVEQKAKSDKPNKKVTQRSRQWQEKAHPKTVPILTKPIIIERPVENKNIEPIHIAETKAHEDIIMGFENLNKQKFERTDFQNLLLKIKQIKGDIYNQRITDYYKTLYKIQLNASGRQKVTNDFFESLKTILLPEKRETMVLIMDTMDTLRKEAKAERIPKPKNDQQTDNAVRNFDKNPAANPVKPKGNQSSFSNSRQNFFGTQQNGDRKKTYNAQTPGQTNLGKR